VDISLHGGTDDGIDRILLRLDRLKDSLIGWVEIIFYLGAQIIQAPGKAVVYRR
jgi:hypothetical protein